MKKHIGILASMVLYCSLSASAQPPSKRPTPQPQSDLRTLGDAVESLDALLLGRHHPLDLVKLAWEQLPAKEKRLIGPDETVIAKRASYVGEGNSEFWFSVLTVSKLRSNGELFCRSVSWNFRRQTKTRWTYSHSFGGMADTDRLGTERDFWCNAGTTFPPASDATLARTLHGQLMKVPDDSSIIDLHPTTLTQVDRETGAIIKSEYARPEIRDQEALIGMLTRWQASPEITPYIGVTKSPYDALLYVDAGDQFWTFSWRNRGGHWKLTDWSCAESHRLNIAAGRARLCTVPVIRPATAAGGMGSAMRLSEMDSESGQRLIRFFNITKLNNQPECFEYFGPEVSKQQRLEWWHTDHLPIETLAIANITTTQTNKGLVRVNYSTPAGNRTLQCKMLSDRIQITGISRSAKVSHKVVQNKAASAPSQMIDISPGLRTLKTVSSTSLPHFREAVWMNIPPTADDVRMANYFYQIIYQRTVKEVEDIEFTYLAKKPRFRDGIYTKSLGLSKDNEGVWVLWIAAADEKWKITDISGFTFKQQGKKWIQKEMVGDGNLTCPSDMSCRKFAQRYCLIEIKK
jgi:hypothetical protein